MNKLNEFKAAPAAAAHVGLATGAAETRHAARVARRGGRGRAAGLAAVLLTGLGVASEARAAEPFTFKMTPTFPASSGCAPDVRATVRIVPLGFAERMTVTVRGLQPGTGLDLFTIQVPGPPFGIGWYVGDLEIGADGTASESFVGRFSSETFVVAVGAARVPVDVHEGRDATGENPTMDPIHTFHLGAWFNSPADAARNGCPNFTTPFNGEHNAGPQVLNTAGFPDRKGPLRNVE